MVMPKSLSVKSAFIKPKFIEQLGEEGLTAKDIADSLGVTLDVVHRKIKRGWSDDNTAIFKATPYGALNETNGLQFDTYAFDTVSAKAFIARWKNERGDSYLQFLFGCEKAVMEEMPKLLNRIKELEHKELMALPSPKKQHHLKNTSLVPVYQMGMFGQEIVEYRRVLKNDGGFSDLSRIEGRITHLSQCMMGMASSIKNLMAQAIVERRK
jgi:hypothetical protein